ncbi:MAG: TRAM domain-containing protein, partial [Gaiella sp.]
ERRLRALAASGAGSRVQGYRVAVHPRTLSLLAGAGGSRLAALEEATRRRFFLVEVTGHVHGDHLEVLAEGRLDDLRPASALEDGAELEVKLVEVGLHDPGAGVAKVDGVDVVVADAAKLVGKKATVRIGRALDGQAFATLVATTTAPVPITFESEAEKPTRAPTRRKTTELDAPDAGTPGEEHEEVDAIDAAEPAVPPAAPGEGADEDEAGHDGEAVEDGAAVEGEERPKKRTRRGSRGGKRRKKKPVEGADAEGEAGVGSLEAPADETEHGHAPATAEPPASESESESEPETTVVAPAATPRARRTPRIHVPASDGAEPAEVALLAEAAEPAAVSADDAVEGLVESENGTPGETDGAPPKKRTRRGSRGGRGRRKKPAASGDGVGTDGDVTAETGGAPADAGEDDASGNGAAATPGSAPPAPRAASRTRAKSAASAPAATPPADDQPEDGAGTTPAVEAAQAPDGYVPMSEWLDDFERASRSDG